MIFLEKLIVLGIQNLIFVRHGEIARMLGTLFSTPGGMFNGISHPKNFLRMLFVGHNNSEI